MSRKGFLLIIVLGVSLMGFHGNAFAVFGDPIMSRSSEVMTEITETNGIFLYNYTVINTSTHGLVYDESGYIIRDETGLALDVWPLIVDYEVPLSTISDIWNISSPNGWTYEILSDTEYYDRYDVYNPFGAAYILHWYDAAISWNEETDTYDGIAENPIAPLGYKDAFPSVTCYENSINGFIFSSNLSPVDGPYLSSWQDAMRYIGDPPLPGNSVGGGGTIPYQNNNAPVPEPSTMLLIVFGFMGMGVILKKRANR